jgi:hypothetical protein
MIPNQLADQMRTDVVRLKEAQERFLQAYHRLCDHFGGPDWQKKRGERVFHEVRTAIIPMMEQAGMDSRVIQGLCSLAEKHEMQV